MSTRDLTAEELEAIKWQKWHLKLQRKRLADIQRRLCRPYPKQFPLKGVVCVLPGSQSNTQTGS